MINIPTLQELYVSILADLESEFNIGIPLFGKNFLRAMAAVQAGKLKLSYLYIGKVQKNIFVDTADPLSIGGTLERFGLVKLGRLPFPATPGEYELEVTGDIGAVIPAQTTFKSNDDSLNPSKLFILDNQYTLVSTIDTITVRSLESGLGSQLSVNDELTSTSPIALVDSLAKVTSETLEPQAAEDIEEYRDKAIQAYRLEAQGGAGADYRLWAADAQGVNESYPYATSGQSNEIDLFVEATIIDSIDNKGTPTTAILDAVKASIEDPTTDRPSRKPLGVFVVNYLPVNVLDVDIEISSYVDLTPAKEALILSAVTDALSKVRPFVSSIDVLSEKNDIFDVNQIVSLIISAVPGSTFGSVNLVVGGGSTPSFTFLNGDIPFLNSITYV